MKHKNKKNFLIGLVVVVGTILLLGYRTFAGLLSGTPATTRDLAMSCTLDMYTQFHIHPQLKITVNGVPQTIPANTGISLDCMHPLHTHDTSGTIHVESPEQRDFTLGDFFAVWGKSFSKDVLLDNHTDAAHEIVMTVDGAPNTDFENLILKDKAEIVLEYRAKTGP